MMTSSERARMAYSLGLEKITLDLLRAGNILNHAAGKRRQDCGHRVVAEYSERMRDGR
jgi:hypothetical protein